MYTATMIHFLYLICIRILLCPQRLYFFGLVWSLFPDTTRFTLSLVKELHMLKYQGTVQRAKRAAPLIVKASLLFHSWNLHSKVSNFK